jgi:YecR-like lipoprotein
MRKCFVPWILAALLAASACAVRKDWFASGGSRADGTVQLSYTWGLFEQPVVDGAQGVALAASKCAGWGYSGAEPFGGAVTRCNSVDYQGNCNGWVATVVYQCVGNPGQ